MPRFSMVGLLLACSAPVFAQSGRDSFNQELQNVWGRLRPAIEQGIEAEARARLRGEIYRNGDDRVEVRNFRAIRFQMQTGPGLAQLRDDYVEIAVPVTGRWEIEIEADLRVRRRVLFFTPTVDLPRVRARIVNLRLTTNGTIDHSDPTRPQLTRADQPRVEFRVELRAANPFVSLLARAFQSNAQRTAERAVNDALRNLAPTLQGLSGLPGPVPADGAASLTDSGAPTPFAEVVSNVERKIRRDHVPHGTLMPARMDQPSWGSWESDYVNGGPGNAGSAVGHEGHGDSAIFTGQWLASQAFRWSVTQDPDALDQVRHALSGVGKLLDVNNGSGLLARCTAPESSPTGQELARSPVFARTVINGEVWLGKQNVHGISRDQYSGVFFGLAVAHDLVQDPAIQSECALRLTQMLDYLIASGWFVDGDRPPFVITDPDPTIATFWAGVSYQQLAWLNIGERVAPGRYAAELARVAPQAQIEWFQTWITSFNLHSYYKFNLQHLALYNFFRLETDATRWQDMARAYRITQRYVGHHWNPVFDVVQTTVDPGLRGRLFPCITESVRRFMQRPHRRIAPAVIDLSSVQWVTVPNPVIRFPGDAPQPPTITIPNAPLDPAIRSPESFYMWQWGPFSHAQPGEGDVHEEGTGLDLVQPYWMGRHHGVGF